MKAFRLLVLMMLALLLPLRGVSAAALLCEPPPASHAVAVVHGHYHADHDHHHAGFDKGRHCLSSCSAPPLLAAMPTVAAPTRVGFTTFPHLAVPVPTFQSDGQERPPRGI